MSRLISVFFLLMIAYVLKVTNSEDPDDHIKMDNISIVLNNSFGENKNKRQRALLWYKNTLLSYKK